MKYYEVKVRYECRREEDLRLVKSLNTENYLVKAKGYSEVEDTVHKALSPIALG